MPSARDIRAMVSSLEKTMHQVRSSRGANSDVEAREKAHAALEEDVADAAALLRVAERMGVDSSRLSGKVEAAKKLLGKHLLIEVATSGNGSVTSHHPNTPESHYPESPPQHTRVNQMESSRKDDDACSLRSSVAARNAEEIRCREKELRRREEDIILTREMDALELKIMKVRHQRDEDDAEEEDERRNSLPSNNSDRVKNWLDSNAGANLEDVSPPLSPRYIRSPSNSYNSSLSLAVRSETSVAVGGTGKKPTPKPRKSLSGSQWDSNGITTRSQRDCNGNVEASAPPSETSDGDEDDFVPVVSGKNARRTSSTKLKTTLKMNQKTTPDSRVAASKSLEKTVAEKCWNKSTRTPFTSTFEEELTPRTSQRDATKSHGKPEVTPKLSPEKVNGDMTTALVTLQTQQFAYDYLRNLRPKKPFDGKGKEIDFEQYMRKFETAIQTPGLTATLKLSELEFWFVSVAGIRVSRFLLREDKEISLGEAIGMLKAEYGRRRTTPDEMLEDLMGGERCRRRI